VKYHKDFEEMDGEWTVLPDSYLPYSVAIVTSTVHDGTITVLEDMTMGSPTLVLGDDDYSNNIIDMLEDEAIAINNNEQLQTTLEVSCSTDASSTVTFSMEHVDGETFPTWISVDTSTGQLSGTAPVTVEGSDTVEKLKLIATSSDYSLSKEKIVTVTNTFAEVRVIPVETIESSENKGSYQEPTKVTATKATAQSAIGVSAIASIAATVVSPAGTAALNSVVKQMQILSFFTLTEDNFDQDVQKMIEGQNFALLNYNFYSSKSESRRQLIGYLADDQEDGNMAAINFDSTSAFVNILVILIVFAVLVAIHLILHISPVPSDNSNGRF